MKKVKWCVIGAAGIADKRAIPGMLLDPQNELVAVMDRNADKARCVAQKYQIPAYFTDPEEMLKNTPCDAVYIATPVYCHYEHAMLALKYGVAALVEKPVTMNAAEGEKLLTAFREKGLQLSVGYMMDYHNLHRKARELVQSGRLGKINLACLQFSYWYPDMPNAWRQKKALSGGGCIMDLAVHCMALFAFVTGEEIVEVKSFYSTRTFSYEVEDGAVITFRSESGILGHIDVNFNLPIQLAVSKLELYGTEGCLRAEKTQSQLEQGKMEYWHRDADGSQTQKTYYARGGNMYTRQFRAFNRLLQGKPDYANMERAIRIQKLCDTIYQKKPD